MTVILKFQSTGSIPGNGNPVTIKGTGLTIGRGSDNELVLPDPNRELSKRHCAIEDNNGNVAIVDFSTNGTFLNNSPLLKSFIANPNNIGCHTLGKSEEAFKGSQELEKEVIRVLAVDIFKSEENEYDGYIATGGTEANIQALWIYRNLYKKEYNATLDEMVILSSEDTHYSVHKGSNLLSLDTVSIPVDFNSREIIVSELDNIVKNLISEGKKYFMVISNMATTMFGSVDNPDIYAEILTNVEYRDHIDSTRKDSPLLKATDAIEIDNSNLTVEEQFDKIYKIVLSKLETI